MRICTVMNTLTIEFACSAVRNFFKLTSVSSGPSIAIIIGWGKKTSESQFCSLIRQIFHCITLEEFYCQVFHELKRNKLLFLADPFVKAPLESSAV